MAKISELSAMPNPAFYRRCTGDLYLKLNESWHVKAKVVDGKIVGDGSAEKIAPDEEVSVIT